jgi:hypothetical protein
MAKGKKTTLDTVTSNLGQLSRPELEELAEMVAALLAIGEEKEAPVAIGEEKVEKAAAKGHIETKTINGCGPYLYFRYWSGKTLKSKYIGKEGKE